MKDLQFMNRIYATTSGISTSFLDLIKINFDSARSLVEVSIGSTKSIHQVMMVQDSTDVYIHNIHYSQ